MKKYKRYLLAALSLSALLLLTGCVSIDKTTKQPTGFVWNLIGKPMGEAIDRSWPWLWSRDYPRNSDRSSYHLPSRYLSIMEGNLPV